MPPSGVLPDPRIERGSLTLQADSLASVVAVQLLHCVWLCDPMDCSIPDFPVLHYLLEFAQILLYWSIKLVMLCNHLILCCPLLLLPSIFPSIRVFSNESAPRIRWLKYWSFSFSTSPSNEYSGFISFRIDHLAVQWILRSLLQPYSSKAWILQHSAFCLLYGSTITSVHDYWKNHSFDDMNLCQQSDVCAF